jgi:hypothetical protein
MNTRGAGGTPGGVGGFFTGLAMSVVGAYLLTSRITVASSPWTLWGYGSFGVSLMPLLAGVALLFFKGRSRIGWGLVSIGLLIIFAGVVANLQVYFRRTSLFETLILFGLLAGGVGMVARSLRASG